MLSSMRGILGHWMIGSSGRTTNSSGVELKSRSAVRKGGIEEGRERRERREERRGGRKEEEGGRGGRKEEEGGREGEEGGKKRKEGEEG